MASRTDYHDLGQDNPSLKWKASRIKNFKIAHDKGEIYCEINFENDDDFACRTAKTLEETKELIEDGFEYITEMEDIKLFRKRK